VDRECLLNLEDEQWLRSGAEQLNQLYKEHIQVEEEVAFPRAAEMLDSRTIVTIGLEFPRQAGMSSR
jgi:hemerythrin-like domain-containing protein